MRLLPLPSALLVFVLALLPSCRCGGGDPNAGSTSSSGGAEEDVTLPDLPLLPIGLAGPPTVGTDRNAQLDAAKDLFQKGDFTGARRAYSAVVAGAPELAGARFQLARAHARVGAYDDAARELARLVAEDLYEYRGKIGRESDLAAFRATPAGLALRRRMTEVEAAYKEAARTGLRGYLWRGWAEPGGSALRTQVLRLGALVPETSRFVAITAPVENAVAIAVDPEATTEVVVSLEILAMNGSGDLVGERVGRCAITLGPIATPETTRARWETNCHEGLAAKPKESSARVSELDLKGKPVRRDWYRVVREGAPPDDDGTPPLEYLSVRSTGARGPTGWGVPWAFGKPLVVDAKGLLASGDAGAPIALPKAHSDMIHAAWLAPDGGSALVVSNLDQAVMGGTKRWAVRHAISLVDLGKRTATVLDEGEGIGRAGFSADGTIYVQNDTKTRRRRIGNATWEALPGFLLALPYLPLPAYGH